METIQQTAKGAARVAAIGATAATMVVGTVAVMATLQAAITAFHVRDAVASGYQDLKTFIGSFPALVNS